MRKYASIGFNREKTLDSDFSISHLALGSWMEYRSKDSKITLSYKIK